MRTLFSTSRFFLAPEGDGGGAGGGAGGGTGTGTGTGTPPAFNAREHLDDSGSFKPDWHKAAGVSEALGKKFTRPEALARSYEQLEAQIGKKGIIPPGPNATPQERDAFYNALGRPAKPEEYGFTKPDKVKIGDAEVAVDDAAWDAARATDWQTFLHGIGAPKDMALQIMQKAVAESMQGKAKFDGALEQALAGSRATLQKEWGADYEKNMGAAMRAAEQFGGQELRNHPALGNDPVLIRALAKIGNATKERPGSSTRQQGGSDTLSPQDARIRGNQLTQQIAERTKANRQWATSAEATEMKAEKSRMFALANPE